MYLHLRSFLYPFCFHAATILPSFFPPDVLLTGLLSIWNDFAIDYERAPVSYFRALARRAANLHGAGHFWLVLVDHFPILLVDLCHCTALSVGLQRVRRTLNSRALLSLRKTKKQRPLFRPGTGHSHVFIIRWDFSFLHFGQEFQWIWNECSRIMVNSASPKSSFI